MEHTLFTRNLASLLNTEYVGRSVRGFESLPSTNSTAAAWAAEGAPDGSLVVAEQQTSGRGRLGRTWMADAGKNLTFSLVLRPSLPSHKLTLVTLTASISVTRVIKEIVAPFEPSIKWPNDILIEGRKCCGMLLESTLEKRDAHSRTVILGIGLNVNQDQFSPEINTPATSLMLETGRFVPRAPLLAALLLRFEQDYKHLLDGNEDYIRREYETFLRGKGEQVTFRLTDTSETVTGILLGIAPDGALRLDTPSGIRTFYAGEVTTH